MNLKKHPILTGTLILTITGLTSRVVGFFYRIFLSRRIGASGLGIYQLVFPILGLCMAACTSGIQSGISKLVAKYSSDKKSGLSILLSGLLLSELCALFCVFLLTAFSKPISRMIIGETACEPLLFIVACSLPFACLHACFNGYYYGKNNTVLPAASQLLEQLVRVFSVYLFYQIAASEGHRLTPSLAMWGLFCGEIAASLFCLTTYRRRKIHFSLSRTN